MRPPAARHTPGLVAAIVGTLFLAGLLVPFAVVGETWGMAWFQLAAPVSTIVEHLWGLGGNSEILVGLVSLVSAGFWSLVLYALLWLVRVIAKKASPSQPRQRIRVRSHRFPSSPRGAGSAGL